MNGPVNSSLRVLITGTTGMVGKGVLYECLESQLVSSVVVINRHPVGIEHSKLEEIIHKDFFDLSTIENRLANIDACFFCLGVSAVGMKEQDYTHITYDLTLNVAKTLLRINMQDQRPLCFCYVTGQGTDSSEKGRSMWARVKGRTENALLAMPFDRAYMFRPGYIQPTRNIRSRTRIYNALYKITKPLYPLLKLLFPHSLTTNGAIGKAMISVAVNGYPKKILGPRDINTLAGE